MADRLRPARSVLTDCEKWICAEGDAYLYDGATAIIESDRAAVRAAVVEEVATWVAHSSDFNYPVRARMADAIRARFGVGERPPGSDVGER